MPQTSIASPDRGSKCRVGSSARRSGLRLSMAVVAGLMSSLSMAAEPESCPRLISQGAPRVQFAAAQSEEVRLDFVGHATFVIETSGGVRIATDYNDYVKPSLPLTAVTMNKAHSTHYTNFPDPSIRQVLRGWNPDGGEIAHDVRIDDMRIRNVQTNIRDWSRGTDYLGNSIFVFESGQICIAHLGHLHHELTAEHVRQLGQIDVLLVPVDGSYTLDIDGMMSVIDKIGPRVIVPMHFFNRSTLENFLGRVGSRWEVERREQPSLLLVRDKLPVKTKVVVLPGR
jgi:L-ascorbate metabolism protein UlaG (beta-lactamase superfamily)